MPLIVYGLCVITGLNPLYTVAAVICAAVPTAKAVYVLAHEHKVALYRLSGLATGAR